MKTLKTLFTISALLLATAVIKAQNISTEIYQDVRLATVGDKDNGIDPGTLDLLFRLNLNGPQDQCGYFTVAPQFEYANITGIYKRYSFSAGYTLNQFYSNNHFINAILEKSEFQFAIDYGFIERFGKTFNGFGSTAAYKYKVTDSIKLSALLQLTDRKELKAFYNETNTLLLSGFLGLEIKVFNVNPKRR